jgi:hypothetical protein
MGDVSRSTDTHCRPLARVTSAGQRHDCLAFEPVMAAQPPARATADEPVA